MPTQIDGLYRIIKDEITLKNKKGINYLYKDGKKLKAKPWLSDIFSYFYDTIMVKSVIPKKLDASLRKHREILQKEYSAIHKSRVLELACGSGNLSKFLPADNFYYGIDISKVLLKQAYKKFNEAGYQDINLYLCDAGVLPFTKSQFDVCICNLSLNFFADLNSVIQEIKRVMRRKSILFCNVPVPERNKKGNTIHGELFSEEELKNMFEENSFTFRSSPIENGAIIYFKATLE